ncbi:MAG: NlpC/P60 family protein [Propioniciclava sp.]
MTDLSIPTAQEAHELLATLAFPAVTPLGGRRAAFLGCGDSLAAARPAEREGHRVISAGDVAWSRQAPAGVDTVVALSWSGRTAATLRAAEISKAAGLEVISITSNPESPLARVAARRAVKKWQRAHGLAADGIPGPKTWAEMKIKESWKIDGFTEQPSLPLTASAKDRTNTMIQYALDQRGSRYCWGGAGPYRLGFDCSGLVLQVIYEAGYDPKPITVLKHAEPSYRTSRELYGHSGFKSIKIADRKRGDLIFWGDRRGVVHHVAIYLGDNKGMESANRGVRGGSAISIEARPGLCPGR